MADGIFLAEGESMAERRPVTGDASRHEAGERVPDGRTARGEGPLARETPLGLSRGARVQLGYRRGTVEAVRGGRERPYEARILWDSEKRPEYLVFTTLERDHRAGRLLLLRAGEDPVRPA